MIESSHVLHGLFIGRDNETQDLFSRKIEIHAYADGSAIIQLFSVVDFKTLLASVEIPTPTGDELLAMLTK